MLKKLICLLFLIGNLLFDSFAQPVSADQDANIFTSIQDNSYGGKMTIYQNPSLQVLVEKSIRMNEKDGINGYRIQIYSGTGSAAREKASNVKREFLENFPEIDQEVIYTDYLEPYFKVKVGDFRNRNEAFELYNNVKKKFPGSYIVKSKINFPKLELPEGK